MRSIVEIRKVLVVSISCLSLIVSVVVAVCGEGRPLGVAITIV